MDDREATSEGSPRNRLADALPLHRVEVEHAGGIDVFDDKAGDLLDAFEELAVGGGPRSWRPVPDVVSVVDGAPAVIWRAGDLEIPLTVDQLAGLMGLELTPEEHGVLLARYGVFYEIDECFYADGESWQERGFRETFRILTARRDERAVEARRITP